jgi:hypothetical protein
MDWQRMGDIVAEFAVPFVFSISSLANLDNANITAVYVSAALRYSGDLVRLPVHRLPQHAIALVSPNFASGFSFL